MGSPPYHGGTVCLSQWPPELMISQILRNKHDFFYHDHWFSFVERVCWALKCFPRQISTSNSFNYCWPYKVWEKTYFLKQWRIWPEKELTFCDPTTGFPSKWGLRNEHRNFRSTTVPWLEKWCVINVEFLHSYLRCHFGGVVKCQLFLRLWSKT